MMVGALEMPSLHLSPHTKYDNPECIIVGTTLMPLGHIINTGHERRERKIQKCGVT